jgi:hypothetical protein
VCAAAKTDSDAGWLRQLRDRPLSSEPIVIVAHEALRGVSVPPASYR